MTQLNWQGVTIVLLVGGCTSAVVGVFCWVQVAAVGLQAAACFGVAGATGGCAA